MKIKETKSGKYKITGLHATHLLIIKEILDCCDDDMIIRAFPLSPVKFMNTLFEHINYTLSLRGDL